MSFLPHYCHSFRITVIPSGLLSFLPNYCHSFRILSFLPNIVIPSELFRELQILTSSKSFPYPKGEKNGHQRWPYMRVVLIQLAHHRTYIVCAMTLAGAASGSNNTFKAQVHVLRILHLFVAMVYGNKMFIFPNV